MRTLPLLVAAVVATTTVFGARAERRPRKRPAVEECPCTPDCVSRVDNGMEVQTSCAYNASARYDVLRSWEFFATADFLYWYVQEDNLNFGVSTTDVTTLQTVLKGEIVNPDFEWHPGFKLGIGGNFEHDNWDIFAEWTHVIAHNNTIAFAPGDLGGIYFSQTPAPLFSIFSEFFFTNEARQSWRMDYNVVDLSLGRPYWVGKKLAFKPQVGARTAWIHQGYNTSYPLEIVGSPAFNNILELRVRQKDNSWGIGPRFVLDTDWFLGYGFRLFGDIGASLLYTSHHVEKKVVGIIEVIVPGTSATLFSIKDRKGNHHLRPNAEAGLGVGWGTYFDNCKMHFDLAVSYDFNYWVDANGEITLADDVNAGVAMFQGGDLALHGLTVKARVDF